MRKTYTTLCLGCMLSNARADFLFIDAVNTYKVASQTM